VGELPFPDPPLRDAQVSLRAWRPADAPGVATWGADPEILRWTSVPRGYDERAARMYHARTEALRRSGVSIHFAIVGADDDATVLGSCDVRLVAEDSGIAEIGYLVAPEHRRRGVATAAVRLMASWAMEALDVRRVQILAHPDNAGAHRVAEAVGFQREGVLRAWREHGGVREDRVSYSLVP
jgi:ribosomal-protein-alanine N-acetyltransferase